MWNKAVKPAGWSDRLARRMADDERLIQEYAHNGGRGRASQDVERARSWVRHVRDDIGPNGVITSVEVRPDEVIACFFVESDPEQPAAAQPAVPPSAQLTSYATPGYATDGQAPAASTGQARSVPPTSGRSVPPTSPRWSGTTALGQASTPPAP